MFIGTDGREEPNTSCLLFITAVRLGLVDPGVQVQPEVIHKTLYLYFTHTQHNDEDDDL